ncbi:hypothetical protein EVAR_68749_1 [Eumeta japonica]|uniref:Uncharacterized protein n=1 Tax=Eumeta variegata TaxID=151549 RepID=A0A4C2A027_EUMVA|nr:hypothetical protein EVAR_68749_1 [Eumeta japonica]
MRSPRAGGARGGGRLCSLRRFTWSEQSDTISDGISAIPSLKKKTESIVWYARLPACSSMLQPSNSGFYINSGTSILRYLGAIHKGDVTHQGERRGVDKV